MKLKDELIKLKEMLLSVFPESRAFEFVAKLEEHPIGDQNIYRLYYVDYHRIGESYGRQNNNISMINWICNLFMLPEGMTREEGFKVLSYLPDFIEKRNDIEPCFLKSV